MKYLTKKQVKQFKALTVNELYSYLQEISKEITRLKKQTQKTTKEVNDNYKLAFDIRGIIALKTETSITSLTKGNEDLK